MGGEAAAQVVEYLASGKAALGVMPSQTTLVLERFFDETGGMQLVLHAPFGSRLNRAWGLSLRKRFCRRFNFELQAAATEDAIVLSLGQTHSFALEEVFGYLKSATVRDLLIQALLDAPMFTTRWRWNATRSLAVLRFRGGRKVPAPLQRFQAEDLVAAVFPDQLACFENLPGRREVPDHPLVNQTVRDCLEEAMDIAGLEALLRRLEAGELTLVARDLSEPSPLAQEILNARPYAFLDDAPLEERRTQAVVGRRWRDPTAAEEIGALDADAVARVQGEAWPQVEDADELHDALVVLGFLSEPEGRAGGLGAAGDEAARPRPLDWQPLFDSLIADRRATWLQPEADRPALWIAAERLPQFRVLFPDTAIDPPIDPPARQAERTWDAHEALVEILRGRLEGLGPVTEAALGAPLGLPATTIQAALGALQAEGFAMRGRFTPGATEEEWCERRLLARIHRYTLNRLRQEIEPVSAADFMRFLFRWQGLTDEPKGEGLEALAGLLSRLEGFEAPAAAWETEILPARLAHYDPQWLDLLCLSGRALWARLTPPAGPRGGRSWGPVRATPLAFVERPRLAAWRRWAGEPTGPEGLSSSARAVAEVLERAGASFFSDLTAATRLLPSQLEEALGELAAAGWVTSDGFQGLRSLITPASKRPPVRRGRAGTGYGTLGRVQAGRWSLLADRSLAADAASPTPDPEAEAEAIAEAAWALLRRYGVVMRRLLERERAAPPWRDLLRCYRRLEARGEIRGGRFVAGFTGEQFALPEAVGALRQARRRGESGEWVSLSGADPLNLVGIVTPGVRLPAVTGNRVLFRDGVPVALREGRQVRLLGELNPQERWEATHRLEKRTPPLRFPAPGGS